MTDPHELAKTVNRLDATLSEVLVLLYYVVQANRGMAEKLGLRVEGPAQTWDPALRMKKGRSVSPEPKLIQ